MKKWYQDTYRRNLIDMHINDTDDVYLSKFSAEDYFNYLKEANIVSPMIYLQSHVGLCNFPTEVSKIHNHFLSSPHEIKKLVSLCKEAGMKVVGYYSLIFNNQAAHNHPEWEMIDKDNKTWREHGQRYGLCCPNNEEYRKFVITQIEEISKEYPDLDGLFFDMPYWEVLCHCEACQKKFRKPIPTKIDFDDELFKEFVSKRQEWMGEFTKFIKETTNKIMPNVTVEFNFAAVIGCDWLAGSTELINEECEFTGGDLYGDLYNHSFTCKYYDGITKNKPFEYMTCRCDSNLRQHTITKNKQQLESEIMLTSMHHGASLIIDAINPDGSLDHRVSKLLGEVFEIEKPFEKYMSKGELYGDIALYFDSKSQFNYHNRASNKECVIALSKTLIENHYSYKIVANKNLDNLNQYKMLFAPSLLELDEDSKNILINYAKNGGILYLSQDSHKDLLKEFFDAEIVGETFGDSKYEHVFKGYQEVQAYICPTDKKYASIFGDFNEEYPLPLTYKLPIIRNRSGEVKAKVVVPYTDPDNNNEFASIHSNPPGKLTEYPAIIETKYGKGKIIYSIASIESDSRTGFKDIIDRLIGDNYSREFKLEASKYIEMIIFEDNDDYYINLFDLRSNDDVTIREFKLSLPFNTFEVVSLPNMQTIGHKDNIISGSFKKYISLLVTKKEK